MNNIISKQIVTIIIFVVIVENKLVKWKFEHELIVNVIQNRLNNNLLFDYKNEINVYILKKIILIDYKFKGFDIFNNLYR